MVREAIRGKPRAPLTRLLTWCGPAGVAQLAAQAICNRQVGGSNPSTGTAGTLDTPDLERRSRSVREAVFRRSHREHLVP